MEREACFLDNDDLGRLGCASTLLYKVVSIALTVWAVWDPAVPGGGQWVGSPMVTIGRFWRMSLTGLWSVTDMTHPAFSYFLANGLSAPPNPWVSH